MVEYRKDSNDSNDNDDNDKLFLFALAHFSLNLAKYWCIKATIGFKNIRVIKLLFCKEI